MRGPSLSDLLSLTPEEGGGGEGGRAGWLSCRLGALPETPPRAHPSHPIPSLPSMISPARAFCAISIVKQGNRIRPNSGTTRPCRRRERGRNRSRFAPLFLCLVCPPSEGFSEGWMFGNREEQQKGVVMFAWPAFIKVRVSAATKDRSAPAWPNQARPQCVRLMMIHGTCPMGTWRQ